MKFVTTLTILFVASGCAMGEFYPTTLPSGIAGFRVTCKGGKQPCYDKAREACNGNYNILSDTRMDRVKTEMLIECKK